MLNFIKDWAINIVMLVLFIVMIEMLLPRGRMKKYVSVLTGTILIIVIINPVIGLFGKNFDFSLSQTVAARNLDKKEIENAGKLLQEEQLKQTIDLYRNRIIEQISQSAKEVEGVKDAQADIIINEDYDSANFGEIKRIYIKAVVERSSENGAKKDGSEKNVTSGDANDNDKVDTVKVNKVESIKIGEMTKESIGNTVYDQKLNERLSNRIGDVFGVDMENIIIEQIQR